MINPLSKASLPFRDHLTACINAVSEEFLISLNLIVGLDKLLDFLTHHRQVQLTQTESSCRPVATMMPEASSSVLPEQP
jgi:hypothetical protein